MIDLMKVFKRNGLGTDIKKIIDIIDPYYYYRSKLKIDIIVERSAFSLYSV